MPKILANLARLLIAGVLLALAGFAAAQQAYPARPIHFIVPFTPGGTLDPLARLVGQRLTESWGQPVIVENRPGGNTIIGADSVAKAPPDGYTMLMTATTHVTTPSLLTTPYDPLRDFTPVATLTRTELVLVVNPALPANTLQEFIALAKSRPGKLNYASVGTGGPAHLTGELLSMMVGIKMQHIPYKGSGPAVTDLVSGEVQAHFSPINGVLPNLKAGRLKAIAVSGETRQASLPQVPTFTEAGLPGFDVKTWIGMLAPAGTPQGVIAKLSGEIARFLSAPDSKEKLASLGAQAFVNAPDQFAALLKADMAKYAKIIKTANIKIEN